MKKYAYITNRFIKRMNALDTIGDLLSENTADVLEETIKVQYATLMYNAVKDKTYDEDYQEGERDGECSEVC